MVESVYCQNVTTALQIFVNHYFSFQWLRKYLLEKRFRLAVENSDLRFLIQASNDLMFLTRLAYEGFPPVLIFPVLCKVLQSIEKDGLRPFSSEIIRPFYFMAEIRTKVLCSPPALSVLWKKVLTVHFDRQKDYCYYLQAKVKELTLTTPGFESGLLTSVSNASCGEELIDSFISTDWKIRRSIEAQKSLDNQMKYYQSLSTEAHKNGNYTLCSYWDDVIRKEVNGERPTTDFLIAWSIQKGVDASTKKDRIWRIVAGLLENPENIPAIKEIITTVADIEHVFRPFNENVAAVGNSCSLRTNAIECYNIFHEKLLQTFSEWSFHSKTSTENMCKTLKDYFSQYFETYLGSAEAKERSLLEFSSLPVFTEMIQTKFIEYETKLAAYFRALYTKFREERDVPISEGECIKILDQFPYLRGYPRLFYSPAPFYHELSLFSKEIFRGTVASRLYQKAVNIICDYISWFPLPTVLMNETHLTIFTFIMEEFSSDLQPSGVWTEKTIQLIEEIIESFFQLVKRRIKENKRSSPEGYLNIIVKRFVFSVIEGTLEGSFSDVAFTSWKKISTLLRTLLVVDNKYFMELIGDVINDLVYTGTSKNEQTVSQAILLYEQKNYFCCYLHLFKLIIPEQIKSISRLLQSCSSATSGVLISPTANEHIKELSRFTLKKARDSLDLGPMLLFCLFRVYLAVFQHCQQQQTQVQTLPSISHWEEIIHLPEKDISDFKSMQHYIYFLVTLESEKVLTHFPQESLSTICCHMVTDLNTSILNETKEAKGLRTLQWKGRQLIQNSRELLMNLSQQSVKTKKGEEEKSFIKECVNLAVFTFRSIDSEVEVVSIKTKIQTEIRRQPRLKRIVQP
jgi:hypothetical protein